MLKILTTQLQGLFQRFSDAEYDNIEDTARLLAQATIGEGSVYFICFGEFDAILTHASENEQPFYNLQRLTPDVTLTQADRVCIFTPYATDQLARQFAEQLDIPFAVVASAKRNENNELFDMAYTHINLHVRLGLIPSETGERLVMPHLFSALYAYEAIKLSYDEMLLGDDE